MTLFDECKDALKDDFTIIDDNLLKDVMAIFEQYPLVKGNMVWSKISHKDYDNVESILNENILNDKEIFIIADDKNIPVFKTNFYLFAENIYDVIALSTKLFIFNNEFILEPLFPTYTLRLGIKNN
ncbi:hypothetical protein [Gilliamella sp. ESL0405]|uniref:CDI toxin immunity protein n=1 Tax=Gilliamella sp. ESL0405 TaxID=2704653 RepID=UPI001C6A20B4|nr:hypothetical protein [Gilliamella sp. ESL0405]QYN45822.1 hypothetical protein GYM74_00695 [Gilliamella sp. ESL0405]